MNQCPVCKKEMASEKYVYIHIIKLSKIDDEHKKLLDQQNELIKLNSKNIVSLASNPDFYLHVDYAKKYLQLCGIGEFKCEVCSEAFPTYKGLQAHFKQKNSELYFDESHNNFYNKRKETVIELIKQNKTITDIVKETKIPIRLVRELALTTTTINCKFCDKNFVNNNALLNHIKLDHPDYIQSIKELVISEYHSELSIEKIIENHNLLIGKNSFIKIWKDNISNCDISKRASDIAAKTNRELFESGKRKIWCDGLDTGSSEILNKAGFKISQFRLSKNKSRGIDEEEMDPFELLYFNRIKKKFRKNLSNCLKCNVHYSRRRLDVHHIIPFRLSYCSFISNLSLLCSVCHSILHEKVQRLENIEMTLQEKQFLYLDEYDKYLSEPIDKDSGIENPEFYDKKEEQKLRQQENNRNYYYSHKNDKVYKEKRRIINSRFRKNNPEKVIEAVKKYRLKQLKENPELWKQKRKQYRKNSKINNLEKDKM